MSAREQIIQAAKDLLWEKGYENTSPRDIQALSGAGQGSFYHHFKSKRDLAAEAMRQVAEERIEAFDRDMSGGGSVKERIHRFLQQRKKPLLGCRIGRMVWDAAVEDEKLRLPLEGYFRHVEAGLQAAIQAAADKGEITLAMPATQLALVIITTLQGSFTVSRALQTGRVDEAIEGLQTLLDLAIEDK